MKGSPIPAALASLALGCAAAGPLPAARPAPADPTDARLARPPRGDWPAHGRDLAQHRWSPLDQIDRASVRRLAPAWSFEAPRDAPFQATPIVVDGTMYLSLAFDHVVALDAGSGAVRWRYEHVRRPDRRMCCGPANRGVAVGYGKVFVGTVDARLLALDAATGRVAWDVDLLGGEGLLTESGAALAGADPLRGARVSGSTGAGVNMAPALDGGRVVVGITGVGYGLHLDAPREGAPLGAVVGIAGRFGRPGFYAAFDAATGRRVWQFDTVPAEGWEGRFVATTPDGEPLFRDLAGERAAAPDRREAWRFGGGSAWSTPAVDPERGLLFAGTGNPSPQLEDTSRPGDNLHTVSLVALDSRTGALRWAWQQVPHDVWGYDAASPPFLLELERGGKHVPAVAQASKLGRLFVHDRETGALLVRSEPLVPQRNLFARATPEGVVVAPGAAGGVSWSPVAYDAGTGLAYVAAVHWPMRYTQREAPASGGKAPLRYVAMEPERSEERYGVLSAVEVATGRIRWQHRTPEPLVGGVLGTAGGLVFVGEGDGHLDALDAATGALLWRHRCPAGANAPPVTYESGGVQYLAVAAGGNPLFGFKAGRTLQVFSLGGVRSVEVHPGPAAPAPDVRALGAAR